MYYARMLSKELVAASTVPLVLSVLAQGENYHPGSATGKDGSPNSVVANTLTTFTILECDNYYNTDTSFSGGEGSVAKTVVGVLIIMCVTTGLMTVIPAYWQLVAKASVLLAAVVLNHLLVRTKAAA